MKICGHDIEVGDYVKVKYTTGSMFKGSILTGKITKLWDAEGEKYPRAPCLQAQVNNGWCFHDHDIILEYKKKLD